MTSKFVIRDIFKLPGDVTVMACEGEGGLTAVAGRTATLLCNGHVRQSVSLNGERTMLNQMRPKSFRAFETLENVHLSVDEAQSGAWLLSIED